MSNLRPILQGQPSERVHTLLTSARLDVPSNIGRQRTLAALGAGGAALGAVHGANAASVASKPAVALAVSKWVAVGFVSGAVISGTVVAINAPGGAMPPARSSQPAAAPAPPSRRHASSTAPPAVAAEPSSEAATGTRTTPTVAPSSRPNSPSLSAEVATLGLARQELTSGRPAAALETLEAHQQDFPVPRLGPEADMLRIEALLALGRHGEARNLGERLLHRNPDSAFGQRVRSLLAPPNSPGGP